MLLLNFYWWIMPNREKSCKQKGAGASGAEQKGQLDDIGKGKQTSKETRRFC